jgi:hypothetical protein
LDDERNLDEILAIMVRHEGNADVSVKGCGALRNLAINDDNKVELMKKGAADVIMKAIVRHEGSADVSLNGCASLRSLMQQRDNCVILYQLGVKDLLNNALKNHPNNVNIKARVRGALIYLNETMPLTDKSTLKSIQDAMTALEDAIKHCRYENVMILCEYFIEQFKMELSSDEDYENMIKQIDNGLKLFTETRKSITVTHLLMVLRRVSEMEAKLVIKFVSNVVAALVRFPLDAEIAELGSEILANLAADSENHPTLRNIGAVEALVDVANNFESMEEVSNKAIFAIEILGYPLTSLISKFQPLDPAPSVDPVELSDDLTNLMSLFSKLREEESK